MNAIIGYADLASRHIDDTERLKKYMKNIQSCGQNLLSLLNDVLDLARIENNKTEMELSLIHIFHLLILRLQLSLLIIIIRSTSTHQ